jgi:hypothetical protein
MMIKSRRLRWAGQVAKIRNKYKILIGMPEEKGPVGKLRRRWEDNIRMDFNEIEWDGVDWIQLTQDRDHWRGFVNTVMNLRAP